jgi:hypothetical protein
VFPTGLSRWQGTRAKHNPPARERDAKRGGAEIATRAFSEISRPSSR